MVNANRKIPIAVAGCVLLIASISLITLAATKRPAKARAKRPKRVNVALKVGQTAPDFELYTLKHAIAMHSSGKTTSKPATSQPATQPAEGKIRLSSFRGKRPVYLIFASYT
jgi:hypothetical protein